MGAEAGRPLPTLAFGPDNRTEDRGQHQTPDDLFRGDHGSPRFQAYTRFHEPDSGIRGEHRGCRTDQVADVQFATRCLVSGFCRGTAWNLRRAGNSADPRRLPFRNCAVEYVPWLQIEVASGLGLLRHADNAEVPVLSAR